MRAAALLVLCCALCVFAIEDSEEFNGGLSSFGSFSMAGSSWERKEVTHAQLGEAISNLDATTRDSILSRSLALDKSQNALMQKAAFHLAKVKLFADRAAKMKEEATKQRLVMAKQAAQGRALKTVLGESASAAGKKEKKQKKAEKKKEKKQKKAEKKAEKKKKKAEKKAEKKKKNAEKKQKKAEQKKEKKQKREEEKKAKKKKKAEQKEERKQKREERKKKKAEKKEERKQKRAERKQKRAEKKEERKQKRAEKIEERKQKREERERKKVARVEKKNVEEKNKMIESLKDAYARLLHEPSAGCPKPSQRLHLNETVSPTPTPAKLGETALPFSTPSPPPFKCSKYWSSAKCKERKCWSQYEAVLDTKLAVTTAKRYATKKCSSNKGSKCDLVLGKPKQSLGAPQCACLKQSDELRLGIPQFSAESTHLALGAESDMEQQLGEVINLGDSTTGRWRRRRRRRRRRPKGLSKSGSAKFPIEASCEMEYSWPSYKFQTQSVTNSTVMEMVPAFGDCTCTARKKAICTFTKPETKGSSPPVNCKLEKKLISCVGGITKKQYTNQQFV